MSRSFAKIPEPGAAPTQRSRREGRPPAGRAPRAAALSEFLLGRGRPPDAETLRSARLAGWAYTALPADHPLRPALREPFLAQLARHHEIKRELGPLVAAWRRAGVEALLFKGFHLAEFVYPVPGARFHGDVDICIRPEREADALRIARELGWVELENTRRRGRPHAHGICALSRPGGATRVDLHRHLVHSRHRFDGVQRRITAEVWARSRTRAWEGTRVRLPDPVDAGLVLALQRCWGDRFRLKPHDATDLRALIAGPRADRAGRRDAQTGGAHGREAGLCADADRACLRRADLRARARALGCARTVDIFLRRLDPWEQRLDLAPPPRRALFAWSLAVLPERGPVLLERRLHRLWRAPAALVDVLAMLPTVARVLLLLRRERDIHRLLETLTPSRSDSEPSRGTPRNGGSAGHGRSMPARGRSDHAPWRPRLRATRGLRWATRLIPLDRGGSCLVRSLALYTALRQRGWPVEFVSGIRRDGADVVGHAWVELNGRVLPELREPNNRSRYRVNVRFPPGPAVARPG